MKAQKTKYFIFATVIVLAVITGCIIASNGNDSKFKNQLKLGNEALFNMDYEDAITAFANAIGLNPKDVEAYLGISKAYIALEDYSNAANYLSIGYYSVPAPTILGMLDPIEVKDLVSLGNEFLSKGESILAEDAFVKALKTDPSNEEAEKGKDVATNHPNYNQKNPSNSSPDSSSDNPIYDDTSDIPLTGGISSELVFDPYSFTFMGYPIHEDHYEEWKSNLGYTPYEDSIAGSGNGYGLEMVFSATEDMKAFYLIDHYFEETNTYEHVSWSYLGGGYTFIIRPTSSYSHVIDSYFSGPIVPGTTLSELLNLIGYKGDTPADDEYIKLDNGFTVMLTHDTADLFYNEYYDSFLSLQRGNLVFTFGLNGDAVARMNLNFY